MEYVYTPDNEKVIYYLTRVLLEHLKKREKVVWLLSGGSAIDTAVAVAANLKGQDLSNLSISMIDERYGAEGHANENWQQLLDKGFVAQSAELYRPLIQQDRTTTTMAYGHWLRSHIEAATFSIGLFGIGPDGHTAGIKPNSTAATATGWTTEYTGEDYERMTMTFEAIKTLDEAVVQVLGDDKKDTLKQLLEQDIALETQPAQIFKQMKKSILFTDYKEE